MENQNIYQKLSSITNELSVVAKNLEVGYGKSQYKAVGEADVLRAVKPLEAKYGVYSYPYARKIIDSGVIENVSVGKDNEKIEKKQLFERIETVYRFVNIDNPQEYIDITTYGDGIDSQDKSVGKAMTYADKYALLKAYKIITGDDPDQNASQELKSVTNNSTAKISKELLDECGKLNIALINVAKYYKKSVDELTDEEVKVCIERKKAVRK